LISIQETIERVLELSSADDCIVIAHERSASNVRWANNTTTTNGVADSRELFVISIKDKRVGTVGSSYFPEDRLASLVAESEKACDAAPEAEDFMSLIEGAGEPGDWKEPFTPTGIEALGPLASSLAGIFGRAEGDDIKLFGFAEHTTSTVFLANSKGLRKRHTQLEGKFEMNGKSADFKRSAWVGRVTKDFTALDLDALYARLAERLEWSNTPVALPPGRYEVLLEPSAVADMLVYSYWTSAARDADEGRTVFSRPGGGNRIGEGLYPESVAIYSDPTEPGFEVAPFLVTPASSSYASLFDNGLDTPKTEWVKDGILQALITTRSWATRNGVPATPYVDNLIFPSTGPSLEEMIASTKRALLITCFWYIREVDPQTLLLTGLTRDGIFLVEDGEVKGAVNNFRFNMSPVDMLAQSTELGASGPTMAREFGDYFSFIKAPPIRVRDFNMSSVSEAT
jgi:predicted Zn-dependent protease